MKTTYLHVSQSFLDDIALATKNLASRKSSTKDEEALLDSFFLYFESLDEDGFLPESGVPLFISFSTSAQSLAQLYSEHLEDLEEEQLRWLEAMRDFFTAIVRNNLKIPEKIDPRSLENLSSFTFFVQCDSSDVEQDYLLHCREKGLFVYAISHGPGDPLKPIRLEHHPTDHFWGYAFSLEDLSFGDYYSLSKEEIEYIVKNKIN